MGGRVEGRAGTALKLALPRVFKKLSKHDLSTGDSFAGLKRLAPWVALPTKTGSDSSWQAKLSVT